MTTVLKNIDELRARKNGYHSVFASPIGQEVLRDLEKFCRAAESCFHPDPRIHARLEGRRDVILRISQHLNLTTEQLFQILGGQHLHIEESIDE